MNQASGCDLRSAASQQRARLCQGQRCQQKGTPPSGQARQVGQQLRLLLQRIVAQSRRLALQIGQEDCGWQRGGRAVRGWAGRGLPGWVRCFLPCVVQGPVCAEPKAGSRMTPPGPLAANHPPHPRTRAARRGWRTAARSGAPTAPAPRRPRTAAAARRPRAPASPPGRSGPGPRPPQSRRRRRPPSGKSLGGRRSTGWRRA